MKNPEERDDSEQDKPENMHGQLVRELTSGYPSM
jgi:hypothetical protein